MELKGCRPPTSPYSLFNSDFYIVEYFLSHHCRVNMVFADDLAPLWRQGICNHHDDIDQSVNASVVRIRKGRDYVYATWQYKVIGIKMLFERKMICKTWVIYLSALACREVCGAGWRRKCASVEIRALSRYRRCYPWDCRPRGESRGPWGCNALGPGTMATEMSTMMTGYGATLSALLALCEGNHQSPVDSPRNGPVTRAYVFIEARLIKLLNKQWSGRWFQMQRRSCDVTLMSLCSLFISVSLRQNGVSSM